MKIFDYACDARVSLTITAETREEADRQWEDFCAAMARLDDNVTGRDVPPFFVWLTEDVPEVEEVFPLSMEKAFPPPASTAREEAEESMSDSMKATCEKIRQGIWRGLCDHFGEDFMNEVAESQARWLKEHEAPAAAKRTVR